MFYTELRFWLFAAALLPFLLCLVFYGFRSPWRDSRVGKSLMVLYGSLVAVLLYAVVAVANVFPEMVQQVARVVLLGGISVAGWIQFANVLHFQRQARRCRETRSKEL